MLLTSTYTPTTTTTTTDAPVVIVCYGERRRFMIKAHTYSQMMGIIREKFDIAYERGVSLETGALEVCHGGKVEIDEDAWPVMRSSLDEINVVVTGSASTSGYGGLMVEDEEQIVEGLLEKDEESEEDENEDDDGRAEPRPPSACSIIRRETRHLKVQFAQRHSSALTENMKESVDERDQSPVSPMEEDEDRDENASGSGSGDEAMAPPVGTHTPLVPAPEEERAPPPVMRPSVRTEIKAAFSAFRRPGLLDEPPKAEGPSAAVERFLVRITGPNPHEQVAEMRTRGGHLVKRVLSAACKTFDLDYNRATLYRVVLTKDDEGGVRERCVRCPPDYTMAQCGVRTAAELKIEIEPSLLRVPTVFHKSK